MAQLKKQVLEGGIMCKNVAFTICAKNYIGLAQILESSIKQINPDIDFCIFVADEINKEEIVDLPTNIYIAKNLLNIGTDLWEQMSFWYDLTSFCTAIKPFCFEWMISHTGYEKIIYFDPDIYVFGPLDQIWDHLKSSSVVLTPHILHIETVFTGDIQEKNLLCSGIYNLGFIAMKRSTEAEKLIAWWSNRLIECCTADSLDSYFYDQRWIDFLPALMERDSVVISRNMGLNLAPWNFFERKVEKTEDFFYVSNRHEKHPCVKDKLIFVHFSGYDYALLQSGETLQRNIKGMNTYPDMVMIMDVYSEILNAKSDVVNKYIALPYTYNRYTNGTVVEKFHRRLFYSLKNRGEQLSSPFSSDGRFYSMLKANGMFSKKNDIKVDKVTHNDLEQYGQKLYLFNKLMKVCYKMMGYGRYVPMLRLLKHYSRFESQIHLLDKKYMKDNVL